MWWGGDENLANDCTYENLSGDALRPDVQIRAAHKVATRVSQRLPLTYSSSHTHTITHTQGINP